MESILGDTARRYLIVTLAGKTGWGVSWETREAKLVARGLGRVRVT